MAIYLVPVDINPHLIVSWFRLNHNKLSHPSCSIVRGIFKISSLASLIFYGLSSCVRVYVQVCVIPVVASALSSRAASAAWRAQLVVPQLGDTEKTKNYCPVGRKTGGFQLFQPQSRPSLWSQGLDLCLFHCMLGASPFVLSSVICFCSLPVCSACAPLFLLQFHSCQKTLRHKTE